MRVQTLIMVLLTTLLYTIAFAQEEQDDAGPPETDEASSPAEAACDEKTLATGSGAADAIRGFCAQVDNNDSDNDNPNSVADTALNGYAAGGFDPSGVMTTARLASAKGCKAVLDGEDDCLAAFWDVCQKGDKFGRGVGKKACMEFKIE